MIVEQKWPAECTEILYRGDGKVHRSRGTYCTEDEGRTRQEDAAQADLGRIVGSMVAGGLPEMRQGVFADISDLKDLHGSLEQVRRARLAFNAMTPAVRAAFANDMAKFVDAFQSEQGRARLCELGVIDPSEDVLADRREAAIERRAIERAAARALAERVEAAKQGPAPTK